MALGDLAIIYHSGDAKSAVGVAKITKDPFDEPGAEPGWVAVGISAMRAFKRPVPLSIIKSDKILQSILLVRHSRISVSPIKKTEFDRILELSQ